MSIADAVTLVITYVDNSGTVSDAFSAGDFQECPLLIPLLHKLFGLL